MKTSQLTRILGSLLEENGRFFYGDSGVGKSSIVKRVAEEKGLEIMDVRAPRPHGFERIPYVEEGLQLGAPCIPPIQTRWKRNSILDELNAAPPLVQASLYQLTLIEG